MNVKASAKPATTTVNPHPTTKPEGDTRQRALENVADAVVRDSRQSAAEYCKESVAPFGGE